MINRLEVKNLHGKQNLDISFNEDINILTGINGSGKTTILKLIWLTISGNIEHLINEVQFDCMILHTTDFFIEITQKYVDDDLFVAFNHDLPNVDKEINKIQPFIRIERTGLIDEINKAVIAKINESVFFPTFRRIEGGFSINNDGYKLSRVEGRILRRRYRRNEFQDQLENFSDRMSVAQHKFVCSISTNDIVELITKKYADMSERLNTYYVKFSNDILSSVKAYEDSEKIKSAEIDTLRKIWNKASEIDQNKNELLKPFTELNGFVDKIFNKNGIKITENLNVGKKLDIIDSNLLSAGEKQMLSFLVYNTFVSNSPFFIDEPELSLHVDWQRILFSTLVSQGSNNQYFIATHSPSIYSKYADKEILLENV